MIVFAVRVTSSPNASPAFGAGAALEGGAGAAGGGGGVCAKVEVAVASEPATRNTAARRESGRGPPCRPPAAALAVAADSSHVRERFARASALPPMHDGWHCANISPY